MIVAGVVVLSASACGGGSPPRSNANALAFAVCMRSNGVAKYPDPTSGGQPVKESLQQLGVSSSRFESAESACRHLLPDGGNPPSTAQAQRVRALSLQFAECVRAHGVPNFPDPDSTGRIPDPAGVGIDQGSPAFEAANRACGRYRPPYMPSNAEYNAYLGSHHG